MQISKVTVSSSPHIREEAHTRRIMLDVLIALIPALLCGIIHFGLRSLYITLLTAGFSVLFEYLWQRALHKKITVCDLSAAVTGVLLGLSLPVMAPWWLALVGAFFSIIIAKQMFGGLGSNFVNPALAGRAFLLASWPVFMTTFIEPFSMGFFAQADLVTTPTPLSIIKSGEGFETLPSLLQMFFGTTAGCIGETSAFALLLGAAYLVVRRVITLHIPLAFLGTVAILPFLFSKGSMSAVDSMLYNLLGGGLFLSAFFMATDYVTSPMTKKGQLMMGAGCGLLTFLIRFKGGYPEGVTYAILLMNIATPLLDKLCRPKRYGHISKRS